MCPKMSTLISVLTFIICVQSGVGHVMRGNKMFPNQKFSFDKPSDYPTALINKIYKRMPITASDLPSKTKNRCGDRNGVDKGICKSTEPRNSPIYTIEDTEGNIRTVIQTDLFNQTIPVSWCKSPGVMYGEPFSSYTYDRYTATCKETPLDYKFLVLSSDMKSFEIASVNGGLPICCRCHLEEK